MFNINETRYRVATVSAADELDEIVGESLEIVESFTEAEWAAVRAVAESVMVLGRHEVKMLVGSGPDTIGTDMFDAADTHLVGVDMAEAIVRYRDIRGLEVEALRPEAGRQHISGPDEVATAYAVYLEWLGTCREADTDLTYGFAAVEGWIRPSQAEAAWGRFMTVLAAAAQMGVGIAVAQLQS